MNDSWVLPMVSVNKSNNLIEKLKLFGYPGYLDLWTDKDERQSIGNDTLCQKLTKRLSLLVYPGILYVWTG